MPSNKFPGISDAHVQRLLDRKPFRSVQSTGYVTKGGTYIYASSPLMNDNSELRDLFVILPDDTVIPLSPLANTEPIERILREGL